MAAKKQNKLTRRAGNHFWQVKNLAGNDAELILYGTISDTSWWGDEITPKQFIDDIKGLGSIDTLTVRINSGGGDVFAAQAIGAQIESLNKAGTETVCRIDGLCASAATIIAAHCKKTVANSDALYMIHLPSVYLWDACDENELQAYLNELKAVKDSILQLYAKKTGQDMDVLTGWMEDTSWFTANEAKENGFIDEVDEDAEPALIENRAGALFVNSVDTGLCMNEAPDYVKSALRKQRRFSNTKNPADAPENKEEPKMAENKTTGAPAAPAITTGGRPAHRIPRPGEADRERGSTERRHRRACPHQGHRGHDGTRRRADRLRRQVWRQAAGCRRLRYRLHEGPEGRWCKAHG